MGDCRPTTSGRDELSEKEKQVLGGFWVYVQPMSLYRHIQQRQQFQVGAQCLLQALLPTALAINITDKQ